MKNSIVWMAMSFLIVSACAEQKSGAEKADTLEPNRELAPKNELLAAAPQPDIYSDGKSKLIKTAHVRFEVVSVKKSTEAIEAAIIKYPAYISSSNLHLENPILENKITIRVQSEFFQDLLKEIDHQAVFVNFRDVTTDDVSKEFVDLESRIKTKREVEERYMEILRKKAGTLKELLEAEQQIGAIHEEIEATIGRLNFLKDQVRYSNINLEFYQTITHESLARADKGLPGRFGTALMSGLTSVIDVAIGIAYVWPLALLAVAGVWIFRLRRRRTAKVPAI